MPSRTKAGTGHAGTAAVQEIFSRFDSALMIEATRDSLYITEANTPMIYLRYMPKDGDGLPVPF